MAQQQCRAYERHVAWRTRAVQSPHYRAQHSVFLALDCHDGQDGALSLCVIPTSSVPALPCTSTDVSKAEQVGEAHTAVISLCPPGETLDISDHRIFLPAHAAVGLWRPRQDSREEKQQGRRRR
jgi:hypothetical protein